MSLTYPMLPLDVRTLIRNNFKVSKPTSKTYTFKKRIQPVIRKKTKTKLLFVGSKKPTEPINTDMFERLKKISFPQIDTCNNCFTCKDRCQECRI